MPLNDMQIRRAKPEAKAYTFGDATQLQRVGRSTILRLISPALSKYTNPIISHS